jgi:hydrogenase/urease accessory protein HupE
MMILLLTAALLIGIMLGLRFKVLILVPTAIAASAITLGVGIAYDDSLHSILLTTVLVIATLQMGYLVGTALAVTRVSKDTPASVVVAQRATH